MYRTSFLRIITTAIALVCCLGAPAAAQLGKDDVARYQPAFKALDSRRWNKALRFARRAEQRLPAKFIRWLHLREQGSGASFAEISAFAAENPAWPGTDALRCRAEEAIDHRVSDTRILAWFAASPPISTAGRIAYGAALLRSGKTEAATDLLRAAWIEGTFRSRQERRFYRRYRKHLRRADHVARLERLIWDRHFNSARRMLRRVDAGHAALAQARIALGRMQGGVNAAIARVPDSLKHHPGLVYERMRWRRRKGRVDDAAELLAAQAARYSWLRSLAGSYVDFWQVTSEALDYAMATLGIHDSALRARLMQAVLEPELFEDARPLIEPLKTEGKRTAILSNGSPTILRAAVMNTDLITLLDAVLSVDVARVYKPHPGAHRIVIERFVLAPEAIVFFSANSWDAAGAAAFGLRAVWVNKPELPLENVPARPEAEIDSLAAGERTQQKGDSLRRMAATAGRCIPCDATPPQDHDRANATACRLQAGPGARVPLSIQLFKAVSSARTTCKLLSGLGSRLGRDCRDPAR